MCVTFHCSYFGSERERIGTVGKDGEYTLILIVRPTMAQEKVPADRRCQP